MCGAADGRVFGHRPHRRTVGGRRVTCRSRLPAGSPRHGHIARTHDAGLLLQGVVRQRLPPADPEKDRSTLDRGCDANRSAGCRFGSVGRTETRGRPAAVLVRLRTAARRLPDRCRDQLAVVRLEYGACPRKSGRRRRRRCAAHAAADYLSDFDTLDEQRSAAELFADIGDERADICARRALDGYCIFAVFFVTADKLKR